MKINELLLKIEETYGFLATNEQEALLELLKKFKSGVCKEQRESCANIFYENKALPYNLKMLIQNAPEPV